MELVKDREVNEFMAAFEDPSDKIRLSERDLLIQVREAVKYLRGEVVANQTGSRESFVDHEKRIRVLENFRYWILGAIAAAGFLGGMIAKHLPW